MLTGTHSSRGWMRRIQQTVSVAVASVVLLATLPAMAGTDEAELLEKARVTFISFMFDEELGWFHANVKKAKAVFVIPELYEAAVGIGGSKGDGVLLVRDQNTGEWSQPAFYDLSTLSLGLKAGAQKSDVVLMIMTKKALAQFYKREHKVGGGDMKLTVIGGTGVTTSPKADLASISRSEGMLVGASLGGAKIQVDEDANQKFYGKAVSPREILVDGRVSNPQSAALRQTVKDYAQ